ncbi:hypothetical protein NQZ68_008881, partial [Dissostichus eleginoides]
EQEDRKVRGGYLLTRVRLHKCPQTSPNTAVGGDDVLSLDMIERYLEQQLAVAAALLSADVCRNAREIDTLDNSDIRDAEDQG